MLDIISDRNEVVSVKTECDMTGRLFPGLEQESNTLGNTRVIGYWGFTPYRPYLQQRFKEKDLNRNIFRYRILDAITC